jgi:hypothetical protein
MYCTIPKEPMNMGIMCFFVIILGYKKSFSTGARKAIVQRGCKYPEQVGDHLKSFVLVLLAGSGAGKFLAPYVMYKSMNIYDSWCSRGLCIPAHPWAGLICTALRTGISRFFCLLEGKKILIDDNLASHILLKVIQSCRENNTEFFCLAWVHLMMGLRQASRPIMKTICSCHPVAARIFPQCLHLGLRMSAPIGLVQPFEAAGVL